MAAVPAAPCHALVVHLVPHVHACTFYVSHASLLHAHRWREAERQKQEAELTSRTAEATAKQVCPHWKQPTQSCLPTYELYMQHPADAYGLTAAQLRACAAVDRAGVGDGRTPHTCCALLLCVLRVQAKADKESELQALQRALDLRRGQEQRQVQDLQASADRWREWIGTLLVRLAVVQ